MTVKGPSRLAYQGDFMYAIRTSALEGESAAVICTGRYEAEAEAKHFFRLHCANVAAEKLHFYLIEFHCGGSVEFCWLETASGRRADDYDRVFFGPRASGGEAPGLNKALLKSFRDKRATAVLCAGKFEAVELARELCCAGEKLGLRSRYGVIVTAESAGGLPLLEGSVEFVWLQTQSGRRADDYDHVLPSTDVGVRP